MIIGITTTYVEEEQKDEIVHATFIGNANGRIHIYLGLYGKIHYPAPLKIDKERGCGARSRMELCHIRGKKDILYFKGWA